MPHTAPNEQIEAEITQIKKNYAEARLLKIIAGSLSRRKPLCPVVNECGGCVWQHISYPEQLKQKQDFIKYQLKNILPENIEVPPVVPSPNEYYYRNRVQIHVRSVHAKNNVEFGFFKAGTNSIVPIENCAIASSTLFRDLSVELQKHTLKSDAAPHKFELALDSRGARIVRDLSQVDSEFTQVNSLVNDRIQAYVVDAITQYASSPIEHILDLYCGSGNITEPLANRFTSAQIIGVEVNAKAIATAQAKNSTHIKYIAQDVAVFLSQQTAKTNTVITVDPARAGLGTRVCEQILSLKPALIVYVSCSLPSLARDLQILCKENYKIVSVKGFDMFPQTEYVETIVVLLPRDMKVFCSS